MSVETIDEGEYDTEMFAEELAAAPRNLAVGTSRLFENGLVRVCGAAGNG